MNGCSDDDDEFNERLVRDLVKRLDGPVQIPLSTSDKALLATIIEGTFEVRLDNHTLPDCRARLTHVGGTTTQGSRHLRSPILDLSRAIGEPSTSARLAAVSNRCDDRTQASIVVP